MKGGEIFRRDPSVTAFASGRAEPAVV
jgi:hypothetical protein